MRTFVDIADLNAADEPQESESDSGPERTQETICTLDALANVLDGVNAAACELAHLKAHADASAGTAESLASSSEKLFISVFEISQSTEEAASEAMAADDSTTSGLAAVNNAIGAIGNIASAVEDTAKKLDDLSAPQLRSAKSSRSPTA